MLNRFLTSIFGSRNERVLRQLGKVVQKINALEPEFEGLSDDEKLKLLSQDGMLIKRPILDAGARVLVGFDEAAYAELAQ